MPTIQALLLDADGVLQLPGQRFRVSLDALCADPGRTDDFRNAIFATERQCLTGAIDFESALGQVLRKWHANVPVEIALRIWNEIEPAKDMLALVDGLRSSGVSVSLATNQQAHRAGFMTHSLGYAAHFDHLLYSCELGHSKPSAEFFLSALEQIAADPAEVLFIDDLEPNVVAARSCGLYGEVFHISEGVGRIHEILNAHGLALPQAHPTAAGAR